jgi:hypothetical protein
MQVVAFAAAWVDILSEWNGRGSDGPAILNGPKKVLRPSTDRTSLVRGCAIATRPFANFSKTESDQKQLSTLSRSAIHEYAIPHAKTPKLILVLFKIRANTISAKLDYNNTRAESVNIE